MLPLPLTERVLARLGFSRPPAPDGHGLRELYGAWCRKVPFDNVRKMIHLRSESSSPLPGDTAEDFFEAWLQYGTGGTCWAGNGALKNLLRALGFEAERGLTTMLAAPDIPPNHGTVLVRCEGRRLMLDATGAARQDLLPPEQRAQFLIENIGLQESIVARLPPDLPLPPFPR